MSDAPRLAEPVRATLVRVLDTLIPPSDDGRLPGAGAVVIDYVEQQLARSPELVPLIEGGVAAIDARARERGSGGFDALSPEDAEAVLRAHAETDAAFVPLLTFHTYAAYYQSAAVKEALGLEARPPYPGGYIMEPSDFTLLDHVRDRGPVYRST